MTTEASLIIKVDSSQAATADKTLASLAKTGATAEKSTDGLTNSTNAMATATRAAISALGTLGAALSVREVIQMADARRSAENQLRLVTASASELAGVEQTLLGVANDTRSGYEATANLYSRLTRATQEMGLSQQDLIGITTTINQSFAVSGATAAEAAAAITQLSQGLAAGALRGDEFNSVAEQAPGIMRAIADSLNMTTGELRSFAAEGGITAEIVVNALQGASDKIAGDFSKANMTFGQSMVVAKNNMLEFVGGSDAVQGSLSAAGSLVVGATNHIDELAAAAGIAALAFSAQMVPAMVATVSQMGVMATAAGGLRAALMLLAGPGAIIAGAATAMYLLVDAQKEAADAAWEQAAAFDGVRASIGKMTEQELVKNIMALDRQIEATKASIAEETVYRRGVVVQTEELRKLNLQLSVHTDNQAMLSRQLDRVQAGWTATRSEIVATTAATVKQSSDAEYLNSVFAASAVAVNNTAGAYLRLMGITEDATKSANAAVQDWAAELKLASADVTALGENNTEVTQAGADEWRDFRNSVSDAFADMIVNGESAGDAIVASFKRTFAKILADFAVSGIAGMFTGQGMGGFSLGGALSGAGASGKILSSVLGMGGGGAAANSAAGYVSMMEGAGASFGGGGIGAAVSGGLKSLASGASNLISAIPGWGWALGAAAIAAAALDKSTPSHNAGLLLHDVPGAKADQKFTVAPFASGFAPVGFARRENQDAATKVIDVFRQDDAVLTELAKAGGYNVNLNASTFRSAGLSETGQGDGVFLGSAREEGGGSGASIESQRAAYVAAYVRGLSGQIGAAATADILAAGSADDMINRAAKLVTGKTDGSHAMGLDYVPFDGYRAELHKGEKVSSAAEVRDTSSAMNRMATAIESLRADLATTAASTRRTADMLIRLTRDGESLMTTSV